MHVPAINKAKVSFIVPFAICTRPAEDQHYVSFRSTVQLNETYKILTQGLLRGVSMFPLRLRGF